jgi:hypothetical protein
MMEDEFHTEEAPNHGRGRCVRVVVVWKLNMEEGLKEFYCVAQNPKVAQGIREQFRAEATKHGIKPRHYVTFQEVPVVWSRTVFKERYRLIDLDTDKIIWAKGNPEGEFSRRKSAVDRAIVEERKGALKNYAVVVWNRRYRRWDISEMKGEKSKLPSVREFTKRYAKKTFNPE